jgi:hypothetical protein
LRPLPLIDKESNIINALNLTNDSDEHICVCNKDGSLYGLVTNSDIVASVDPQVILESLQIATIFEKKFGYKSFLPDTPMAEILDYMKDSLSDCVIIQKANSPAKKPLFDPACHERPIDRNSQPPYVFGTLCAGTLDCKTTRDEIDLDDDRSGSFQTGQ